MRIFADGLNATQNAIRALDFRSGAGSKVTASVDAANDQLDISVVGARDSVLMAGQGYTGETYQRASASLNQTSIDGSLYFIAAGFYAGDIITNLHLTVSAAGSGMTLSKVGVWATDGQTRLGVSAEQGTGWQSTGTKTIALTTPLTVAAQGVLYLGLVAKTGTTMPGLLRTSTSITFNTAIGTGVIPYGVVTGQTDAPATFTVAVGAAPIPFWMGWS